MAWMSAVGVVIVVLAVAIVVDIRRYRRGSYGASSYYDAGGALDLFDFGDWGGSDSGCDSGGGDGGGDCGSD